MSPSSLDLSPAPPAPVAADYGYREGVNPFAVAAIVGFAAFMEVLDISIANVSLRNIAGGLAAGQDESTWVLTSYLVANAIVLPITGWLSMMFGRTRFYLISMAIFTVSSLLCGLAPSLPMLILFRVIQGLGGGALQPVSQAILADAFPGERRAVAFAIYGMSVVAAPAIGPTLGGWITDTYDWHWIFLINVPIGVLLLSLTRSVIRDPKPFTEMRARRLRDGFKVDYLGFALIALGLGSLQIMLDKGQQDDWLSSNFIVAMAVTSVVALVGMVFWELRQKDPMVNLRLLRHGNFGIGLLMMFALGFVLLSSTLLLPLMTQTLFGYTATDAGLVISPGAVLIIFMMPAVGVFAARVDPRRLIAFGFVTVACSMFYMTRMDLDADYRTLMLARMFQTFGLAFLFIPINAAAFVGVSTEHSGDASALVNVSRNIGSSVGTSLMTTLLARFTAIHEVTLGAHVSRLDPNYAETVGALTARFGSSPDGQQQVVAAIVRSMEQQASMLSYTDVFALLGIGTLCAMPLVLLLKRPQGPPPPGAH